LPDQLAQEALRAGLLLPDILGRRKFDKKITASTLTIDQPVDRCAAPAGLVRPTPTPRIATDPDDDVDIGPALAAKADLVVTGDKPLLSVAESQGVRIGRGSQAAQIIGIA
jgi:uncharacterized protein